MLQALPCHEQGQGMMFMVNIMAFMGLTFDSMLVTIIILLQTMRLMTDNRGFHGQTMPPMLAIIDFMVGAMVIIMPLNMPLVPMRVVRDSDRNNRD